MATVQRSLLSHQRQAQPRSAWRSGGSAGEPPHHLLVFFGGEPA
ncbi:MAG: hypothetical protein QOE20_2542, partial [Mycobacterium sp.]|nr:hypothetical protein [Mycobacterium sp.]